MFATTESRNVRLDGKSAIITGGASGIGSAISAAERKSASKSAAMGSQFIVGYTEGTCFMDQLCLQEMRLGVGIIFFSKARPNLRPRDSEKGLRPALRARLI